MNGRMGLLFPSLCIVPRVKVGKVKDVEGGKRGHAFMSTEVSISRGKQSKAIETQEF